MQGAWVCAVGTGGVRVKQVFGPTRRFRFCLEADRDQVIHFPSDNPYLDGFPMWGLSPWLL